MQTTASSTHITATSEAEREPIRRADVGYQAYQTLHVAFVLAPLIAGLDKFCHLLTDWSVYLAPAIAGALNHYGITTNSFMRGVGVIEIVAGLLVVFKPRIGAYVVAMWLLAIIANSLVLSNYYDVALRDFSLFLGAIALGRLSHKYGH